MSIYNLTLQDVLREWWEANPDNRYAYGRDYINPSCIMCKTCQVTWIRVVDNKFEYALETNKDQFYLDPGDPQLFEKFAWVLKTVKHDPDYACGK